MTESRIAEIVHDNSTAIAGLNAGMEELLRSNKRIECNQREQGVQISSLNVSVAGMANEVAKVSLIDGRVNILESKPGKKWEKATWHIITTILTIAVTAIVTIVVYSGAIA